MRNATHTVAVILIAAVLPTSQILASAGPDLGDLFKDPNVYFLLPQALVSEAVAGDQSRGPDFAAAVPLPGWVQSPEQGGPFKHLDLVGRLFSQSHGAE
jgi:hypothetical protein